VQREQTAATANDRGKGRKKGAKGKNRIHMAEIAGREKTSKLTFEEISQLNDRKTELNKNTIHPNIKTYSHSHVGVIKHKAPATCIIYAPTSRLLPVATMYTQGRCSFRFLFLFLL
jgi:hypothetical protein